MSLDLGNPCLAKLIYKVCVWKSKIHNFCFCRETSAIFHLHSNSSKREEQKETAEWLFVFRLCLPLKRPCTDPLKGSADFLGAWLVQFTLSSIIPVIRCATGHSDSFHDAEVYGNCKSIKPQFALNKMKQQVVKWKLNPKLENIFQEKSLSLPLLLLPSFEKFNRADRGNLEGAGYSFLRFIIAP